MPANIEPAVEVLEEIEQANRMLDGQPPEAVLRWAAGRYGAGVTLACSFGGPTGMVLMDMAAKAAPAIEVFYIDTGFLFPETYDLVERASKRYGAQPIAVLPRWTAQGQAEEFGEALWASDPDLCCQIRKVEPNGRALEGKDAWISGLRRDQSKGRGGVQVVDWDYKFGLVKISPLAAWSEADVWRYIRDNSVPYNALHDQSYPSIGCTHCTRAVAKGEDPRAGRWAGQGKEECGLHADTMAGRETAIPAR